MSLLPNGWKVARLLARLEARVFRPAMAMFTGNDAVLLFGRLRKSFGHVSRTGDLVATGGTYFRDLSFDDLHRMQFDLETTRSAGFQARHGNVYWQRCRSAVRTAAKKLRSRIANWTAEVNSDFSSRPKTDDRPPEKAGR